MQHNINYTLQEEMLAEDSTEAESVVPGDNQEAPDAGQVMAGGICTTSCLYSDRVKV